MARLTKRTLTPTRLGAVCGMFATLASASAMAQGVLPGGGFVQATPYGSTGVPRLSARTSNMTSLGLVTGIGETDNVFLTAGPKRYQTLAMAGVNLALSRQGPRFNTSMKGEFEDLYFVQNAFGNQVLGRFDGDAILGIIPNRLDWAIDESFGQSELNPVAPTVPTNLQNVNVVSTGPDLVLHPGGMVNFLQLGARYSRSDFGRNRFNGYEETGLVTLGRETSSSSTAALHVEVDGIHFTDKTAHPNYTLRRAYLSYDARGARTRASVRAGATQVNDTSRGWTTRPTGQLSITREVSPTMTINVEGGRDVTNIAESFSGLQSGAAGAIIIAPASGTTSSYVGTYASASWHFSLNRTSISASARWEQDVYRVEKTLNTRVGNYELRVGRSLTPNFGVQVTGTLLRTDYYEGQFSNDFHIVGVAFEWKLARKLRLTLQYRHSSRGTAGVVNVLSRSGYFDLISQQRLYLSDVYSANTVFVTATYQPVLQ